MNFEQIALRVAEILKAQDIPYMFTGALAVNYHGKPRMTHDIDVVVLLRKENVPQLKKIFDEDFFIDEESIFAALKENSMFNIIHKETGLKVDFWIRKNDDYSQEAFRRRGWYPYQGTEICLATPEDMIIEKLEWFKRSEIDKHYFDALGIYRIQKEKLDIRHIDFWCQQKSIQEIWERIKAKDRP